MERTVAPLRYDDDVNWDNLRRRRWVYLAAAVIFTVVVALAVVEGVSKIAVYGVTTRTANATAGDSSLEVRYPRVSRGSLVAPLAIKVERRGGFSGPIRLSVTSSFFDLFLTPSPQSTVTKQDETVYVFDTPVGDELEAVWDSSARPLGWFTARHATVALLDDTGAPIVSVRITSSVRP